METTAPAPSTTLGKLVAVIKSEHEEYPIHEAIARYAEEHAGKRVTKRDVKKLEELYPEYQFTLHPGKYSWEGVEIAFWKQNQWNETRSELRIAQNHTHATFWSGKEVREHVNNARYFKFAQERNAERDAVLSSDNGKAAGLAKAASLVDQIALLHAELKATIETYELDAAKYKIREQLEKATDGDCKI